MTDESGTSGAGVRPEKPARHLVLLRHAKADRSTGGPDAERPLTARGHADAAAAGVWLRHEGYLPTVVICSPAKRTRQTWHDTALGMAAPPTRPLPTPPGGFEVPAPTVRYEPAIYQGHASDLLDLVRGTDAGVGIVLLIGHNPTISELSTLLDPVHADPEGLRTGGVVVHGFDETWTELRARTGPVVRWHTARG